MKFKYIYLCTLITAIVVGACSKKMNNDVVVLPPPVINYITPTGGPVGTVVTISGKNFGSNITVDTVWFNGVASVINYVNDTAISVSPPAQATTGAIALSVAGKQVTGPVYTVTQLQYPPIISSVTPTVGLVGTTVTIKGKFFGTDITKDTIRFNGAAAVISSLKDTMAIVTVPAQATTGNITLAVSALKATGPVYTVAPTLPPPVITSFTPASGLPGTIITITGNNFGTLLSQDTVWFNGRIAAIGAVTNTTITAAVPQSAGPGAITVSVSGQRAVSATPFGYTGNKIVSVSTFAGTTGTAGNTNGNGTAAKFNGLRGCTIDAQGNLYVAEIGNNDIRKITPSGDVTTVSGGTAGYADGAASTALFNAPRAASVDASGNLIVVEYGGNRVRKINLGGSTVTTLAGATNASAGTSGTTNGVGTAARFYQPQGVVVDPATGNIYVAEYANNCIRKITIDGSGNATVSTFAGTPGAAGGTADGVGAAAQFNGPLGLALDKTGNYLIESDNASHLIRKIEIATGKVTTIAGSPTITAGGYLDGTGTSAYFLNPAGVAVDTSGNIIVCDYGNHCMRSIDANGVVTTFAGQGKTGCTNGTGCTTAQNGSTNGLALSTKFFQPCGVAVDKATNNVYVVEYGNHDIRLITTGY
ncbi:IPT/TIG domain-containing protein [Chitinophagaceae bacterium LWZ2-11]